MTVGNLTALPSYQMALWGTLGPPDFDRISGTRISKTSAWCVESVGSAWALQSDALLYDQIARQFSPPPAEDRGVAKVKLDYLEIDLSRVNEVPAGFDKQEILRDRAGNRKVINSSVILLMRPGAAKPPPEVCVTYVPVRVLDEEGPGVGGRDGFDVIYVRRVLVSAEFAASSACS